MPARNFAMAISGRAFIRAVSAMVALMLAGLVAPAAGVAMGPDSGWATVGRTGPPVAPAPQDQRAELVKHGEDEEEIMADSTFRTGELGPVVAALGREGITEEELEASSRELLAALAEGA